MCAQPAGEEGSLWHVKVCSNNNNKSKQTDTTDFKVLVHQETYLSEDYEIVLHVHVVRRVY